MKQLSDVQQKILELIEVDPKITVREVCTIMGFQSSSVGHHHIHSLLENGFIVKKTKGRGYLVVNPSKEIRLRDALITVIDQLILVEEVKRINRQIVWLAETRSNDELIEKAKAVLDKPKV